MANCNRVACDPILQAKSKLELASPDTANGAVSRVEGKGSEGC